MKAKNLLIYTLCALPLSVLLRILQYIYIIDTDGNYVTASFFESCLKASVAVILLLSAAVGIVYSVLSQKTGADMRHICSKRVGVIYIVVSALMLVESGIRLGKWFSAFDGIEWVGITGVLAAAYYAVQGTAFVKGQKGSTFTAFLGFFPPAYFCIKGVGLFFGSFKLANISENRLEMLAICALALMSVTFSAVRAGAEVKQRRVAVTSMLCCVFAVAPLGAQLLSFITSDGALSLTAVLWLVQKLLLAAAAFIVLARISFMKEEPEASDPEPIEFNKDLNVYIDDIPEDNE